MIPVPSGVRVWLAVGRTDMRKCMNGLALQVQQGLGRDPHAGAHYVFRGARWYRSGEGCLSSLALIWRDCAVVQTPVFAPVLETVQWQASSYWPVPSGG